jgi:hypothetical protein
MQSEGVLINRFYSQKTSAAGNKRGGNKNNMVSPKFIND